MTSQAIDLATVAHAFKILKETGIGRGTWIAHTAEQELFINWMSMHHEQLAKLGRLDGMASPDYQVLNKFLQNRNLRPVFERLDGIGVASVLDMLVKWAATCRVTTITTKQKAWITSYPAFHVPGKAATVFDVQGYDQPLVRIATESGDSLWLVVYPERSGIRLALAAQSVLQSRRTPSMQRTAGAIVPMVDMNLAPDISWLQGMTTFPDWSIQSAQQEFKLRMNETGARVMAATAMVATRSLTPQPEPYAFTKPFLGFFTQNGVDGLATAAFWAGTDVWHLPGGNLEEL